MSGIYKKGEKEEVEGEPLVLQPLGFILKKRFADGKKTMVRTWLLYNFNIGSWGWDKGNVKYPETLDSVMKVVAEYAFEEEMPMAEYTKEWLTRHGMNGASTSTCYGDLLREYGRNSDEYKLKHTDVQLYGMTDQSGGKSQKNRDLRVLRLGWVGKTWFSEVKPEDANLLFMLHKSTDSGRRYYFKRKLFGDQIKSVNTKLGRKQHRGVMIFKIPPPALTVSKQLELAKKYHLKIANDALDKLDLIIGEQRPEQGQRLVRCMLNKLKSENDIEFNYFNTKNVDGYLNKAKPDWDRQLKDGKKAPDTWTWEDNKGKVLSPFATQIFDPKTGKMKDIEPMYSNMKFDFYGAIRCSKDIPDLIKRCTVLGMSMVDGFNHIASKQAAVGDGASSVPVKGLAKWIVAMQDRENSINHCGHAYNG
jgi:hypothetical protein